MASGTTEVQVRVNEGVLWVAGEAYPLRTISHVGQRVLEVNRGAVWKKFVLRTLLWLIFGGILAAVLGTGGKILWFAVEALLVWGLVSALARPPAYGLIINTAGVQHDAVWSLEKKEIEYLVYEITRAIGHPDVAQMIYNMIAPTGDVIQQYGANNIGKAQHSGSGHIGFR